MTKLLELTQLSDTDYGPVYQAKAIISVADTEKQVDLTLRWFTLDKDKQVLVYRGENSWLGVLEEDQYIDSANREELETFVLELLSDIAYKENLSWQIRGAFAALENAIHMFDEAMLGDEILSWKRRWKDVADAYKAVAMVMGDSNS